MIGPGESDKKLPGIILHIGYRIAFLQYRRKFWRIAIIFAICGEFSSANLCESPIFSPYTVIYLVFQLSWLLVPCLTINFGDFLCDLFVEVPNCLQILLTSTVNDHIEKEYLLRFKS